MNETMILDDLYSFSPCIIKILYDCDEEDDKIKKCYTFVSNFWSYELKTVQSVQKGDDIVKDKNILYIKWNNS